MVFAGAAITVFAVVLPLFDLDYTHPVVWIGATIALAGTVIAALAIRSDGRR